MEAVAAFGLAANVLQVVDFAHNLLSTGRQIYQAGSTVQNAELEVAVKDFIVLNKRLKSWIHPDPNALGPLTRDGQSLEALALESERIAQDLITILETLHVDRNASKYKSFLQAVRTAWNTKRIVETKQRLEDIRKELQYRIQLSTREDILQTLDEVSRQVILAVLQTKDDISRRQQASDALASKRHNQILQIFSSKRVANLGPEDVLTRIKAQLYHQTQNDRFDDIVEAHQTTFKWVLQENAANPTKWPNLYTWLREGRGVYWISGKAGSGKSTLMKFLHQNTQLQRALNLWAGNAQLLIINFYFWNAGSDLQKSQEGLFRSLLHQVLKQAPSLGPVLFPEIYALGSGWRTALTSHEVRRAFGRFTTRSDSSIRVVMLIDGLDEFDATDLTMTELAELFILATRSPSIKALLSSRPLAPFEFSFEAQPKLRLHQLTHNDITIYVNDKLAKNSRMVGLSQGNPQDVQALIGEIVDSASGVFLWVKLVVRSLLEGLQNYDRLPDLQKRLRALPRDLESLFAHMLRNIPAEYTVESSQILQIVRSNDRYQDGSLTTIALAYAEVDEVLVLRSEFEVVLESQRLRYEDEVAGRLRSRCAGLLEVRARKRDVIRAQADDNVKPILYVDYLHKSVADYLTKDNVWSNVTARTRESNFDANLSLLRSLVMQIKRTTPGLAALDSLKSELWNMVNKAMYFARMAEMTTRNASPILLDELDRAMSFHLQSVHSSKNSAILSRRAGEAITHWCDCAYVTVQERDEPWHDNFLAFAIRHGLTLYVQAKLRQFGNKQIQKAGRPLLAMACCPTPDDRWCSEHIRSEIVGSLLEYGADPNQTWGRRRESVWKNALSANPRDSFEWVAVLKLLVLSGADPNAYVESELLQGAWKTNRMSALRILKSRYAIMHLQAQLTEEKRLRAWQDPVGASLMGIPPPSDSPSKLKVAVDDLVNLLLSKGAKEEEWHMMAGSFKKVYPEEPSIFKKEYLEVSKPQRNIFIRLMRRDH